MNIKKAILIFGVLLTLVLTAAAQDYPKMEVALDYSYLHFVPAKIGNTASLNGGGGQFTYNFTKFIGIKADFQGYQSGTATVTVPLGPNVISPFTVKASGDVFTYMAGPQIKYHGRFAPFAEVLFGGAHSNFYGNLFRSAPAGSFIVGTATPSNNGFAMAAGGGIDIRLSHTIALRPAEFDFLLTRFGNPITRNNNNQDNFRYSAGVVFQFGS